MAEIIWQSFYFGLPAFIANMSPVILDKLKILKFLAVPIDGGRKINGQYILGKNKTWRGLVAGGIFGLLTTSIQYLLYENYDFFRLLSIVDYSRVFIVFGLLSGFGALIGDSIKSFFKRRLNIDSGKSWPIFDQLDFIFGFLVLSYVAYQPSWEIVIYLCIITLVLHPLTNIISYLLGIKKVWW